MLMLIFPVAFAAFVAANLAISNAFAIWQGARVSRSGRVRGTAGSALTAVVWLLGGCALIQPFGLWQIPCLLGAVAVTFLIGHRIQDVLDGAVAAIVAWLRTSSSPLARAYRSAATTAPR
jgi:hypothetical protein